MKQKKITFESSRGTFSITCKEEQKAQSIPIDSPMPRLIEARQLI